MPRVISRRTEDTTKPQGQTLLRFRIFHIGEKNLVYIHEDERLTKATTDQRATHESHDRPMIDPQKARATHEINSIMIS